MPALKPLAASATVDAKRVAVVAVILAGIAPGSLKAAPDIGAMVTDRPTEGASPLVIPKQRWQIESGYKVTEIDTGAGSAYGHFAPDLLLRYGASERVELRAYTSGWNFETGAGDASGFGDLNLGAKIELGKEDGWRPQTGLLIDATLPTGGDDFSSDYVTPRILFLGSHTLSGTWSITYNVGPTFVSSKADGSREDSVDLGYAIGAAAALDDGLGVFVELFGAAVEEGDNRSSVQTGITWMSGNRFQLDARVGTGLVSNEPDWFLGVGVSLRLPD
jgi:hypothetical protein